MLKRFSDLRKMRLSAIDRDVGKIHDILLEDGTWNVRYLIVGVWNTMPVRRVLIAPAAISELDFDYMRVSTSLHAQQVLDSPPLDHDQPVSRQYERALVDHFGWPIYWLGRLFKSPQSLLKSSDETIQSASDIEESSLRSAREICRYRVEDRDGRAGYMSDLAVNLDEWRIELAFATSGSWVPAEPKMFPVECVSRVDWPGRCVHIDQARVLNHGTSDNSLRYRPAMSGKPDLSPPFHTA